MTGCWTRSQPPAPVVHPLRAEAVAIAHHIPGGWRGAPDNNRCEQMIRPMAVGRRNWMFAGSLRGGERMADLLTLVHTAPLNGVEPHAWLRGVLDKLPSWPQSKLRELLPYRE